MYQNPKCSQSSLLRTLPRSLRHPRRPPSAIPPSYLRNLSDSNDALSPFHLIHRSAFRGLKDSRVQRAKRAVESGVPYDEHEDDESFLKMVIDEVSEDTQNRDVEASSEKSPKEVFLTTKHEKLEPSELGIEPEPPSWPEREKMLRLNFERKLKSLGIPLSIQMIQKKLQWQTNWKEASEYTYCSVKRTFSSMMFIIHELQNYALEIRENLYAEDLQGLMAKFRSEMDASFVWLFQKILWKTPSLMVYTMVLLANYSVFSMNRSTVLAACPLITEAQSLTDKKTEQDLEVELDDAEDEKLWNSMVEEANRLQEELRDEALDKETMKQLVAPVSAAIEGDAYEEYKKTDMYYKQNIDGEPDNSLLLSNYAQFLYVVCGDVDK